MHLIDLLPDKRWYWVTASYDALRLPENKVKSQCVLETGPQHVLTAVTGQLGCGSLSRMRAQQVEALSSTPSTAETVHPGAGL